jgi:cysteine desulfurase
MGERLSGNLNFLIEGIRNEPLLVLLNERGIIAGGGSACSAGSKEPSHVLKTIGIRPEDYFSSIRITIGKFNSKDEIDPIVNNLIDCVKKLRELSPFWKGGE